VGRRERKPEVAEERSAWLSSPTPRPRRLQSRYSTESILPFRSLSAVRLTAISAEKSAADDSGPKSLR